MEKVRLQIFNHVSRNGLLYPAETKEEVERLFLKPKAKDKNIYLTNVLQGDGCFKNNMHASVIDVSSIIGKFENIEVVETGDIGQNGYPVFEVYGTLKYFDTPHKEDYQEMIEGKTMTFGMRAIGRHTKADLKIREIENVISFDLISGE